MKAYLLFPTLVGEFQYEYPDRFKEIFFQCALNHLDQDGFSNDMTGHVTIHHEPQFEEIYKFMVASTKRYISALHANPDKFDINVVKSWFNIMSGRPNPVHTHRDSHISCVYYVNIPGNAQNPIRFHSSEYRHEPYHGFCGVNNCDGVWDMLNSYSWQITPVEGQLLVFPASLPHETVGHDSGTNVGTKTGADLRSRRIAIATDILLTFKEKSAVILGIQPVYNWRKFES